VIVAHHMGEQLLVTAAAGGASAVPLLTVMLRARLRQMGRALRRRPK
jgi:hypothetical protein